MEQMTLGGKTENMTKRKYKETRKKILEKYGLPMSQIPDKELKDKILKIEGKVEKSKLVGMSIGKKLKDKKIKKIIFDRNGYKYHGRVKALADGIRESGINF